MRRRSRYGARSHCAVGPLWIYYLLFFQVWRLETTRRKNPSIQDASPALAGLSYNPIVCSAPPNFLRTTFEWPKKKVSFNRISQSHTFGVRSEYLPAYPHIFSLPSPEAKTPFSVPSLVRHTSFCSGSQRSSQSLQVPH
ncbi:hypothetical protein B0H14DRAFT_3426114 [Mycena olivaceomarginata]|nr:hypothetical protein B0H14DRAFT_3426114 [Mycena olivaceomarginata]